MRDEFIAYWTEPNRSNKKLRFELEKTWETKRRLAKWSKNNFSNNSQQNIKPKNPCVRITRNDQ